VQFVISANRNPSNLHCQKNAFIEGLVIPAFAEMTVSQRTTLWLIILNQETKLNIYSQDANCLEQSFLPQVGYISETATYKSYAAIAFSRIGFALFLPPP
jgi:hypothetical protein